MKARIKFQRANQVLSMGPSERVQRLNGPPSKQKIESHSQSRVNAHQIGETGGSSILTNQHLQNKGTYYIPAGKIDGQLQMFNQRDVIEMLNQ